MFHLATWDPSELFYTPDSTGPNYDHSNIHNEQSVSFLTAIETLGNLNGSTTVLVVIHVENTIPEIRVRLSTVLDSSGSTKTTFWKFSVEDWEVITALPRPCVEVLGDIVYRKTTRSILVAEER